MDAIDRAFVARKIRLAADTADVTRLEPILRGLNVTLDEGPFLMHMVRQVESLAEWINSVGCVTAPITAASTHAGHANWIMTGNTVV